mmetsp:Transcript_48187/g.105104  ORF Transcript_48187/g.105104 Transcript_48187/m.105104 type:complete len:81 (+) Transcript_48187:447-689(+)
MTSSSCMMYWLPGVPGCSMKNCTSIQKHVTNVYVTIGSSPMQRSETLKIGFFNPGFPIQQELANIKVSMFAGFVQGLLSI